MGVALRLASWFISFSQHLLQVSNPWRESSSFFLWKCRAKHMAWTWARFPKLGRSNVAHFHESNGSTNGVLMMWTIILIMLFSAPLLRIVSFLFRGWLNKNKINWGAVVQHLFIHTWCHRATRGQPLRSFPVRLDSPLTGKAGIPAKNSSAMAPRAQMSIAKSYGATVAS